MLHKMQVYFTSCTKIYFTCLGKKVRDTICEKIGNSKFCIIINGARYEFKRRQMAIVFRFVNKDGFIQEHFFDIVNVNNTLISTLKDNIFYALS
jgi:hypothetical protein